MSKTKINPRKYIFQIRLYNPLYLDRTGSFIKVTRKIFGNWEGGVNGFRFIDSYKKFVGNLSMYDFSLSTEFNTTHEQIKSIVLNGLDYISDVYEEPLVQRIGYRIIYLCEISPERAVKVINNFAQPQSESFNLLKDYKVDRNEIFLRYKKSDAEKYVNFRLLYGEIEKRDTKNVLKVESSKGLIVDIDAYMLCLDERRLSKEFIDKDVKDFFSSAINNQKNIIQKIDGVVKQNG